MTTKQADYIGSFIGKESNTVQDIINDLRKRNKLGLIDNSVASVCIGAWMKATISSKDRVLEAIERKLLAHWRKI